MFRDLRAVLIQAISSCIRKMSWKRSNCSGIRSVRFILRIEGKYPDDKAKICADGSLSYAAETGRGYIHIKEILDLLKEQKYPGNVIVELYDYSPEHMLEGIGESVSWVAGVLRE